MIDALHKNKKWYDKTSNGCTVREFEGDHKEYHHKQKQRCECRHIPNQWEINNNNRRQYQKLKYCVSLDLLFALFCLWSTLINQNKSKKVKNRLQVNAKDNTWLNALRRVLSNAKDFYNVNKSADLYLYKSFFEQIYLSEHRKLNYNMHLFMQNMNVDLRYAFLFYTITKIYFILLISCLIKIWKIIWASILNWLFMIFIYTKYKVKC